MIDKTTWKNLIAVSDLFKGDVTLAVLDQQSFAVFDADDGIYVTASTCTHAGANLCDGYFDRYAIECPLHQGCFDIRTGAPLGAPVVNPLACYASRVHQGMVQIVLSDNNKN